MFNRRGKIDRRDMVLRSPGNMRRTRTLLRTSRASKVSGMVDCTHDMSVQNRPWKNQIIFKNPSIRVVIFIYGGALGLILILSGVLSFFAIPRATRDKKSRWMMGPGWYWPVCHRQASMFSPARMVLRGWISTRRSTRSKKLRDFLMISDPCTFASYLCLNAGQ